LRLVPYLDGDQKIGGVVLTLVDVTSLTNAEAHQKVLIDELNHRVKNMLMVVMGVAEQTIRTSGDLGSFKDRFLDRLQALSRSYELLSREHWTEASVAELISPHLEPFGADRVRLDGPDIRLNPRQALSLGMVIHELTTNASKHGALRAPDGGVEIVWNKADGQIDLAWREHDGPEVTAPSRGGFGLTLVDRETRQGLGGKARIDFTTSGLTVALTFPA
jgi:two-component system CheB/CheR fusion protein